MKATGQEIKKFFDAGFIEGYNDGYDGLEIYDESVNPIKFLLNPDKEYDLDKDFGYVYSKLDDIETIFLYPPMKFSDAFHLWRSGK